jgi:CDP-diacylglycerol--glycerol-3-phosphate 3-phosphatidyltransferase
MPAHAASPWPPWVRAIPWGLVTLRLALAPGLLVLTGLGAPGEVLAGCLGLAVYCDVLDGVLARRLGVATATLRRYDCAADVLFYLAVLACAWARHPDVLAAYRWPVVGLLALEASCQALSLARFGRTTATHSWSCRAWSALLLAAFAALFGLGRVGALGPAAVAAGYVAYADVLLILLLAPRCPVDVPGAWHAWRLRQRARASPRAEDVPDGLA